MQVSNQYARIRCSQHVKWPGENSVDKSSTWTTLLGSMSNFTPYLNSWIVSRRTNWKIMFYFHNIDNVFHVLTRNKLKIYCSKWENTFKSLTKSWFSFPYFFQLIMKKESLKHHWRIQWLWSQWEVSRHYQLLKLYYS